MKYHIYQKNNYFIQEKPEIIFSDQYIEIHAVHGKSYYGNFTVKSANDIPIKGSVLSTNDKIEIENSEFEGTEIKIKYCYKGILSLKGEEHYGDFIVLTNGGEYNIPYHIVVENESIRIGEEKISSLEEFTQYAKKDWTGAKTAFFSKEFQTVFLQEGTHLSFVYHGLCKGRTKDIILEQFLLELGADVVQTEEHKDSKGDDVVGSNSKKPLITEKKKRNLLLFQRNKMAAKLIRTYVKFRTGAIEREEYVKTSGQVVAGLEQFESLKPCLELISFQLLHVEEKEEEKKKAYEDFLKREQEFAQNEFCMEYYYYLMAIAYGEDKKVFAAIEKIKESYEKTENEYLYWMLLGLDETLAKDKKAVWNRLQAYYEKESLSPLLYVEAVEILNEHPYLMEEADGFAKSVFAWGLRHQYVKKITTYRFAECVMKLKFFCAGIFSMMEQLFQKREDPQYLSAICSLLIKGNKTHPSYHKYYERAVEWKLKLVGLYEYYLRSLDFNTYPILPQTIVYYFTYSNSLNDREKAYLYTNILKYEPQYEAVFPVYKESMKEFAKKQLMAGKINEHLCILYEALFPEILDQDGVDRYLPNIIFKKKLKCMNQKMIGVYVEHEQLEDEMYVPFIEGMAQIEMYSDRAILYFVDEKENRYTKNIEYSISDYLDQEKYVEYCKQHQISHKKILVRELASFNRLSEEEKIQLTQSALEIGGLKQWVKDKALEYHLLQYKDQEKKEKTDEYLATVNYKNINSIYRKSLINYYMMAGKTEDAYFGIELYGSDEAEDKQLYTLACVGISLHKDEKSEELVRLTHRCLLTGKYDQNILDYLLKHYEGTLYDLIYIWNKAKKASVKNHKFEEKLLEQAYFTGEYDERLYAVLQSYIESDQHKEEDCCMYMCWFAYMSVVWEKKAPLILYDMIEQQQEMIKNQTSTMKTYIYLLYMNYFKDQRRNSEQDRMIVEMLKYMEYNQLYFPFFEKYFHMYPGFMENRDRCFVIYKGKPGQEVTFHFIVTDAFDRKNHRIAMNEKIPGIYQCDFFIFADEKVEYYLTKENKRIDSQCVKVVNLGKTKKQNRFHHLYGMLEDEAACEQEMLRYFVTMKVLEEYM